MATAKAGKTVAVKPRGSDGAEPVKPLVLAGMVKTGRGYALAEVTLSPGGEVVSLRIGPSQSHPQFVALELRRAITALNAEALK